MNIRQFPRRQSTAVTTTRGVEKLRNLFTLVVAARIAGLVGQPFRGLVRK